MDKVDREERKRKRDKRERERERPVHPEQPSTDEMKEKGVKERKPGETVVRCISNRAGLEQWLLLG